MAKTVQKATFAAPVNPKPDEEEAQAEMEGEMDAAAEMD